MYELLNSNDPPFRAERVHLENAIIQSHGALAELQHQITEARAVLDGLLEEEACVQDTIESCKTILHPIRGIPEDIIREFFEASLDTDRERKDSLNGKFPPLVLSQVCRDWRAIALSTSRLWSSLRLDFDLYRSDMACLYLLQTYLLRSGMHDITLSIHSKTDLSKSHRIPVLILSAPRWTDLSLSITHKSIHTFSTARGTFHRLSRLSLEVIGPIPRARWNSTKCTFDAFEYAPELRSFTLQRMCAAIEEISLPWSQLNEYAGDDWMSSYIDIFKRAPDMERASLQCDAESEYDDENHPSLSHQGLRVLHLHEVEDPSNAHILLEGGIVRLLSYIEFPALDSLSMSYRHTSIQIPRTLRGSTASSLRFLSIDAPFVITAEAQANLLGLLQTTPFLSSLSMSCRFALEADENEGIFLGLNANIHPDVLPNLSALTIRFIANLQPCLSPLFIDMVHSRRHAAPSRAALRTLRFLAPFVILPANTDAAARWKGLCDEGLVTFSEHR
ncbi:hypothetical protein EV421DRAFT_1739697 [Armillaria borealis]|uniref:F-box domain-containing protein n=1 Tax=Armillaria borealis TaxID=47425 RepID=A0AA39J6N9_9AGAR|nr:hypothetical protein EV421DRAFT_1739697 [Armillaria borealis]